MSETVKVFEVHPLVAASLETVHTVHKQRHLTVRNIHVCNTSNVAVALRICLAGPDTPAGQSSALVWDHDLAGNDFLEFGEGLVIPGLYSIQAQAGADNALVLTLAGTEQ